MAGTTFSEKEWKSITDIADETDRISVSNLQLVVNAGYSIYGQQKSQPVNITAVVCISRPLSAAAASDSIDENTIHYGKMSKNIVNELEQNAQGPWKTAHELIQSIAGAALSTATNPTIVSSIEINTCYPKACNFGGKLSLAFNHSPGKLASSIVLSFDRIHVPALIGVNDQERTMPQEVLVSVWFDRAEAHISESCYEVPPLVYKTVEESAFETLEALTEEVAVRLIKYFIIPKQSASLPGPAGVRVKIEKPYAVALAGAASVEIYRSADPQSPFGKRMVTELGHKRPKVPFPLQGRLDDFLSSWKQD